MVDWLVGAAAPARVMVRWLMVMVVWWLGYWVGGTSSWETASETFCDAHKFLCDAHIFFVSAHKTIFVSTKCSQKKCERSQNKIVSTSGNSGKHYFTNKFSQIS